MRFNQLLGRTLHADPSDAETPSHRLLLRTGMISPLASGLYSYLPLALRSLQKIESIIREEMNAAGGQELRMPALHPLELWQQTGRDEVFGQNLLRLKDRRERELVLAPTHEEVITTLVRQFAQSYRDLPLMLYQIQTKFRDEPRPRAGLIRVREFDMKDAYSFDSDLDAADDSYDLMEQAYKNIFTRCGLSIVMAEADSGAIGGRDSHEFIQPTPVGEDTILVCNTCNYAANVERAASRVHHPPKEELKPAEEVATPGVTTIPELASYLGLPEEKTLKAVLYMCDGEMIFVVVRGDLEVNELKLKNVLEVQELRLASNEEVEKAGLVAGYASPVGLENIRRIADHSIDAGSNFVAGANKQDAHIINANYPRDFEVDLVTDIALARNRDRCPKCDSPLEATRGIEVGHIFKLGTAYSEKLGAYVLDSKGEQQPIIMGCYGIGVGRLLAAVIEANHDEVGIRFPTNVSPFQVYLVVINPDDEAVAVRGEKLYEGLLQAGIEVLYDDRQESAGKKFNDADLLGFPVRLVVSPRSIRNESVEIKLRAEAEGTLVALESAVGAVEGLVDNDSS